MPKSLKQRYRTARNKIREETTISETETELILEFLDAADPEKNTYQLPDGKGWTNGTLNRYARKIGRVARDLEPDLTEATADEINLLMDGYVSGEVESVKKGGMKSGTVVNYQGPMRKFYEYFNDFGVDPEDIHYSERNSPSVDERDIFDSDEVQAIREEAKRLGSRDACLVDLLLYTGQRRSAF